MPTMPTMPTNSRRLLGPVLVILTVIAGCDDERPACLDELESKAERLMLGNAPNVGSQFDGLAEAWWCTRDPADCDGLSHDEYRKAIAAIYSCTQQVD